MIDLKEFDTKERSTEGVETELLTLKTRRPSGAFIKVHGRDSEVYSCANTEMNRQVTEIIERKGKVTSEERDGLVCDMLAVCTIGWRGLPIEFTTQETARKLYWDYPAIREQVDVFIGNRANFVSA